VDLVLRVKPNQRVDLSAVDPAFTATADRTEAQERLNALTGELSEMQELLYGAATHGVLIILQGTDTSGKDGTVRRVFSRVNPLGCRVVSFKAPTAEEAAHDFLWRVHQGTPARGMITIFNRSHYEDVLVTRVRKLVPREVWSQRFARINAFESLLAENGTIILKFFLHISKKEQEQRLLAREQESNKAWKLSASDWQDRAFWDQYQTAYEEVFERCSTKVAPWQIVPANRKWFRDLAVATGVVEALRPYRDGWSDQLAVDSKQRVEELRRYRAEHGNRLE